MRYTERFALPAGWLEQSDLLIADAVSRWVEREVLALRGSYGEQQRARAPAALRSLLAELGLQEIGAEGAPAATSLCAALEQLGRGDPGIALAVAQSWLLRRLAARSAEPPAWILEDDAAPLALVLPGYGRDAAAPSPGCFGLQAPARATPTNDGWLLRGGPARPLAAGAEARGFALLCEVCGGGDAQAGAPELLLVALPRDAAGLRVGAPIRSTGLGAFRNADVSFDDVAASRGSALLAGPGGLAELLCWHYLGASAIASGALLAGWEILREWTDTRVIKGKGTLLKENPLAAALLGEIGARIATIRLQVFGLAQLVDGIGPAPAAAALAPVLAQAASVGGLALRGAMDALDHAMELMGSAGYATEWSLERYWRDVKDLGTRALLGTSTALIAARYYFALETV